MNASSCTAEAQEARSTKNTAPRGQPKKAARPSAAGRLRFKDAENSEREKDEFRLRLHRRDPGRTDAVGPRRGQSAQHRPSGCGLSTSCLWLDNLGYSTVRILPTVRCLHADGVLCRLVSQGD